MRLTYGRGYGANVAVRTLDQILSELGTTFNPQVDTLRQRQSLIPQQITNEETALKAQEQDYYDTNIMGDARRRGLGFAGIPIGERARYGATQFLPSLTRLRSQGREEALKLEDAILGINERRDTLAHQLRQGDVDNDYRERVMAEETRRFNEQQALARKSAGGGAGNSWLNALMGGGAGGPSGPAPAMVQRQDKGYDFKDAQGNPISAARYAQLTNTPIGNVLYEMGRHGDKYAQKVYNLFAGQQQMGMNINKIGAGTKKDHSAIFWGT